MRNVVYVIGQDLRAMWRKESGDEALRKRAREPTQVLPGPCSLLRSHHCPLALRKICKCAASYDSPTRNHIVENSPH